MKTYEELKHILAWEWDYQDRMEEREPWEGYRIDIEATARNAWRAMVKSGTLAKIKAMPEEWQRFESLHLSALEYMDEPWLTMVPA